MKILQLSGAYPLPPLGGMEETIYELALEYAKAGHASVSLATSRSRSDTEIQGARFVSIPAWRLSSWIQVPTPSGYRDLARWIRWADVVHVHNPPELVCYLGSRLAWRGRKPVVAAVVSPGALSRHPRRLFRVLGRIDEWLVTRQIERADRVQVKNSIDRDYVRRFTSRYRFLPDGVPNEFFDRPPATADAIAGLDLRGRRPVVLYLGRVHPLKGPDHLVRATQLLLPRFPDMLTIIAGPAPDDGAAALDAQVRSLGLQQHVHRLGPVDESTKLELIDAASVLAVPSLADFAEGFSMVSSEAWARGTPVAAYAVGALRVRVSEGVDGALAAPGDVGALAEAISRAISIGRVKAPADVLSWHQVASTFLTWYQELLAGHSAAGQSKPGAGQAGSATEA